MKTKTIILLDQRDSAWYSFLGEYFEDSSAELQYCWEPLKMGTLLDLNAPQMVFLDQKYVNLSIAQKLKLLKQSNPDFRIFHLGDPGKSLHGLIYDDIILEPLEFLTFQKQLVQHLVLPGQIKVLLVDDQKEISWAMKEYFEGRTNPSFLIHYEEDGRKALERLAAEIFDVIVLDIRMPAMDGRDLYREIKTRGINVPVIIFFDAIFGDEMVEIHKYGRPAVVDKGSYTSAMPEMLALIKKMVYFG